MGNPLSFTDAAEVVLRDHAGGEPMHYKAITNMALELGLIRTKGQTPGDTMYVSIYEENQRRNRRGAPLRFDRQPKGMIGLSAKRLIGLEGQIAKHNAGVRKVLAEAVQALSPKEFEELVGRLLVVMGFEGVEVTKVSADGGIDARGTLVVGDVVRTRMAVQAKRWKANVGAPVVQQMRGSLGAHDQGLIVTTSAFTKQAKDEAQRSDATPVGLMDGESLISLLVEHGIGIERTPHDLLEFDADGLAGLD